MTKKGYLIVAIATLITVVGWVIFDIIHARSNVQVPADLEKLVEPLDPNLDVSILE